MSAIIMEDASQKELTLYEVAERLGISYDTVLRRIKSKKIRARKEGHEYRVKVSDLEKYIKSTYLD